VVPEEELNAAPPQQRIRTIDQLVAEMRRIATHGYAKVDEEFEEGLVGVSAPVRDFRGQIVAAINVSAPKGRFGHKLDAGGATTAAVAQQLSRELGHNPRETRPRGPHRGRTE
jgi:DNA-binding IclR family transcriptional regulator